MIKVVDSYCGSGKSQSMIKIINEAPKEQKFIYVTPFLKECDRIKESCPKKNFRAPNSKIGKGSKQNHWQDLIDIDANIVCTHALFNSIKSETIALLKEHHYTLVLDEVLEAVEIYDILDDSSLEKDEKQRLNNEDLQRFIDDGHIQIAENGMLFMNENDTLLSKYKKFEDDIKKECLYLNLNRKSTNNAPVKVFPPRIFKDNLFEDIYILTYLFSYQILSYYFQFFGIEYHLYYATQSPDGESIILSALNEDGTVSADFKRQDIEWRREIARKIHVHQDSGKKKYNEVGANYHALSANWYETNLHTDNFLKLAKNLNLFFRNTPAKKRMWTCFKAYQERPNAFKKALKKQGENNNNINLGKDKDNFISINAKATNDYDHKTYLAYLINRFNNPIITNFFNIKGISFTKEKTENLALSDLIQWVWRSAIRKPEPEDIYIYVPSSRMRQLFCDWLYCEAFSDN
ncbi:hypothetical protein SAMN04515624_103155 [Eubacterium maltosivorans]|uniref:hypothetical protein n=1 Tax=Eubacterium maltosivorans TaxID=2041044 RepID=UPI00087EF1C9|nr:hypothetical protein [Eubacterium maltosivorans]WPK81215.1 hypothetical protein EUMA32_26450 [Eubacterium maltosivorans]SDO65865.1 hypothetical protein SAMN04515624_103155 [Eubacterium maltosivorans]